jgi:hypothetical protein
MNDRECEQWRERIDRIVGSKPSGPVTLDALLKSLLPAAR